MIFISNGFLLQGFILLTQVHLVDMEFGIWMNNMCKLYRKLQVVITCPCPNFKGDSAEPPLMLGHDCVITIFMMTSSNGNISRVTGPLCGEFTGPGEFPTQRPVTWSFDVFFDLRVNKRLSKQPWGWWFETPSWSLWHHCNGIKLGT